jgi:uncharacterized protein DUF3866
MAHSQYHLQPGVLLGILAERPGAVEWLVRLADGSQGRAIAYASFAGNLSPGWSVWINTTAVELGLGTGGIHFIVSPLNNGAGLAGELEIGTAPVRAAGHLMKLRYTPLQHAVLTVEEEPSPLRAQAPADYSLNGLPVVAAELHSAAMAIAVAARACGARRVIYVMSDGAALPLAISHLVARLRSEAVLAGTITAGQAFGGDLEAVTVASALAAAREVMNADLVVVAQGPGNAGTGTAFGFSGLAQAEHLNAAAALGGRAVAALRVSFADPRPRHWGLSQHSAAALGRMTLARTSVAVPVLPAEWDTALQRAIEAAGLSQRHDLRQVAADDLIESLRPYNDLLTTMGRTIDQDRAFFLAACAAARLALDPAAGQAWTAPH